MSDVRLPVCRSVGQVRGFPVSEMSDACLTWFLARMTCYQLNAVSQSEVEQPKWVNQSVLVCGRLLARA